MGRLTERRRFEHFRPDEETTTVCVDGYTQIVEPWHLPYTDVVGGGVNYYLVGEAVDKLAAYEDAEEKGDWQSLTANEYQRLAARTINYELTNWCKEQHALFGMASEVGELHGIYQKHFQGHKSDEEHRKKELGDLLWFVAEYCTSQGWELEDVMQLNIEKLKARYPVKFEEERSLHRKDGDI